MAWDVVIAGGGFGGLYAARALERRLPLHAGRITLINDANFLLYTPLLPGAAGGTLEPRHVVVPLREQLRCTDLRVGQVMGADPGRGRVSIKALDGAEQELGYDRLIVALGSVSRTLPIPGLVDHAVGFKTLAEGIALRNHLIQALEIAEELEHAQERAPYLTYMVVGAGYAGVEGLAELQDFAGDVIDRYPRCRLQGMRWILLEARAQIMPEVPAPLAAFATRELRARGVEVRCQTTVERVDAHVVRLSDGESVAARTLVWTGGVRPPGVIARLGMPLTESGRIRVDRHMRVEGVANVWAIGDSAAVPDPARPGEPSPPTAQHAIRQGRRVGANVAASVGVGRSRPFRYRTLGVFVDLGRHQAVASTAGIKWRGFPAWFLARSYHLAMMPGASRKLRLVLDWTVALLFGRDSSELGQLGHPDPLPAHLEEVSAGGTTGADRRTRPGAYP